jgi:hypothetical protein
MAMLFLNTKGRAARRAGREVGLLPGGLLLRAGILAHGDTAGGIAKEPCADNGDVHGRVVMWRWPVRSLSELVQLVPLSIFRLLARS